MFLHDRNTHRILCRLACLVLCLTLQFSVKDRALCQALKVLITSPSRADFATSKLTTEEKERILNEHNKIRSMVYPQAANMEYMVWDDNLANLAQMWSNQCQWGHGFVKFGDQYPYPVEFTGQIGQNIARVSGKLDNLELPVQRWAEEVNRDTCLECSNEDTCEACGNYIQVTWAPARKLGCGCTECPEEFKFYVCNYGAPGRVTGTGKHHYKIGPPCTDCASGNGFCENNLCKDCKDGPDCDSIANPEICTENPLQCPKKCFSCKDCKDGPDCDFISIHEICTENPEQCPKTCRSCNCPLECQNLGRLDLHNCVCSCNPPYKGVDCTVCAVECQNGGTLDPGACRCSCIFPWRDTDCSVCGLTCRNEGTLNRQTCTCSCQYGWYGTTCEVRYYDPVGRHTCWWRVKCGRDCNTADMQNDCWVTCDYVGRGGKVDPGHGPC